jgi:hypothetical protein
VGQTELAGVDYQFPIHPPLSYPFLIFSGIMEGFAASRTE